VKRRIAIVSLLVALAFAWVVSAMDASSFRPWLALSYPDVRWIDSASLATRLERGDVTLIDVRTAEEYDESHLQGALRVGHAPSPDQEVVVYCSLGVRSADYAERLQREGFQVLNLDGGIFAWANAGRPIENEEGTTQHVHPYNRFFGLFLDEN
jgi:rhodanese-related sulfurtransferase